MKILQFNPYQCGAGQVGSKKSKPILTPPRGVGLKSHSTPPHPTTFAGRKNPLWGEVGSGGSSGAGQNCHPQGEVNGVDGKIILLF